MYCSNPGKLVLRDTWQDVQEKKKKGFNWQDILNTKWLKSNVGSANIDENR